MKNATILFILTATIFSPVAVSFAQERAPIAENLQTSPADLDFDGLGDEQERDIYKTDPERADTDGDGYYDGVEVVNGTNPLDKNSFVSDEEVTDIDMAPSWAWYLTRATALISFFLMYVVIFLGLTVRLPFLNRIFSPLTSLRVHAWLSVQALVFASAHGVALMFDEFWNFSLAEVFIPFAHPEEKNFVAMGVIGFYIMILLILTSYFRHLMSHRIWRVTHFFNIILYIIVVIHATSLGTDIINHGIVRDVFIVANAFLIPLFVLNLSYQLFVVIKRKFLSLRNREL